MCVATLAAMTVTVAGWGSSSAATVKSNTGKKLQTVTVGLLAGSAVLAPVYAAEGQRFFAKYGIKYKPVSSSSFATPVAGLDAGSIDIDIVGDPFQQYEAGVKVVGVVGAADSAKDLNMICNSSVDAKTGTISEKLHALLGKRIAFSGVDSPPYYLILGAFKRYGLNIKDITIVNVPVGPTQFSVIEKGEADCTIGDMNAVAYLTPGGGRYTAFNFGTPGVLNPLVTKQIVPWVAKPSYVASHKTAVQGFERAMSATLLWMEKPQNLTVDEKYVVDAVGKTAAPGGAKLETETRAVLATVSDLWGPSGAKESYEADLAAGVLTKPIRNFNPDVFTAPGSPSTLAQEKTLADGGPAPSL